MFIHKILKSYKKATHKQRKLQKSYKLQLKLRRPKKATVALKKLRLDTLHASARDQCDQITSFSSQVFLSLFFVFRADKTWAYRFVIYKQE